MRSIFGSLVLLAVVFVVPLSVFAAPTVVDGDLITTAPNPDIYIVKLVGAKKFKRLILNPDIFNSYGHLKWSNVKNVTQDVTDSFTLSELAIEVNANGSVYDPKIYRVASAIGSDTGERSWLNLTASEFEAAGYDWDSVFHVNHREAAPDFYPTKSPLVYQDILTERQRKQTTAPKQIEPWGILEARYFFDATVNGEKSLTITNELGEKRYYRMEGVSWAQKNSLSEALQPYTPKPTPAPTTVIPPPSNPIAQQIPPPTLEQLTLVSRVCALAPDLKSLCDGPVFMKGYLTNLIFRTEVDRIFRDIASRIQQQQQSASQQATCMLAETPANEIGMDPYTQDYLRKVRCGRATSADETNYQLSQINSTLSDLKNRLNSQMSFPSYYLDPLKSTNTGWKIQWNDSNGGTITDSSGSYRFSCHNNTCQSSGF